MTIVLLEIYDAPALPKVNRVVKEFRRAHTGLGVSKLRTHRSASERELADCFGGGRRPSFLFTDERGEVLARARGRSLGALETGLAAAIRGNSPKAKVPARPGPPTKSRFVSENAGCVIQERRIVVFSGLASGFKPSTKALKELHCISWTRDNQGGVTAEFPTIRAAEQAFYKMLNSNALGISKALPEEVLWGSERMNK